MLTLLAVELNANSLGLSRSKTQPHASGCRLRVVARVLFLVIGHVTMRAPSHPAWRRCGCKRRGDKRRDNDGPRRSHGRRWHVCKWRRRSDFREHFCDIDGRCAVHGWLNFKRRRCYDPKRSARGRLECIGRRKRIGGRDSDRWGCRYWRQCTHRRSKRVRGRNSNRWRYCYWRQSANGGYSCNGRRCSYRRQPYNRDLYWRSHLRVHGCHAVIRCTRLRKSPDCPCLRS